MPDQPDDNLVPPLKVMRKRLNGVYRADSGFSGPTRRYVLIVALLVGLASVPTLAAITAGSNQLADGKTDTIDVPFLPPASPGPISTGPHANDVSPGDRPDSPGGVVVPSDTPPSSGGPRAGRPDGVIGERRTQDRPSSQSDEKSKKKSADEDSPAENGRQSSRPPVKEVVRPGSEEEGDNSGSDNVGTGDSGSGDPGGDGSSGDGAGQDNSGSDPEDRSNSDGDDPGRDDDEPAWGRRPYCHERGRCASPSHHHRPDRTRHRQCEQSTRRAHWSQHSSGDPQEITVHIDPTGRHGTRLVVREQDTVNHRRSAMTDRPQNIRAATILPLSYAGGHDNRRLIPGVRGEDNQLASHLYRGSHRAGSAYHADDQTPAQQRSSRVGRHHADSDDVSSRG